MNDICKHFGLISTTNKRKSNKDILKKYQKDYYERYKEEKKKK